MLIVVFFSGLSTSLPSAPPAALVAQGQVDEGVAAVVAMVVARVVAVATLVRVGEADSAAVLVGEAAMEGVDIAAGVSRVDMVEEGVAGSPRRLHLPAPAGGSGNVFTSRTAAPLVLCIPGSISSSALISRLASTRLPVHHFTFVLATRRERCFTIFPPSSDLNDVLSISSASHPPQTALDAVRNHGRYDQSPRWETTKLIRVSINCGVRTH